MALWKFTNLNKHGNYRTRIIHTKGALSIPGSGLGPTVFANRFKYEYKDEVFPPTLANIGGKIYLMPLWKEVDPNTTLNDINWIKPKPKVKQEPIVVMTVSSSNVNKTYKTVYYPDSGKFHCNCPGRWRAFDGKCKHIKELELKINK
tara:strand:- start:553 stop:993 length:441 start_codon:yes stop_codon:yes gene_type:complete